MVLPNFISTPCMCIIVYKIVGKIMWVELFAIIVARLCDENSETVV